MSQNDALASNVVEDLAHRARSVARNAYAPYSQFRVGCALLLDNTAITVGCNVENSSYRLTCCAEQSAVAQAIALHGPDVRIRAIVVVNLNHAASSPCGACRQTIHEFSAPYTEVFFPTGNGTLTRSTIADLLPYGFRLLTDKL